MYAAVLSAADDAIGQMLATLDRTERRNNTVIFLLDENGATTEHRAGLDNQPAPAGRNSPFRDFKFSPFDSGMHVPALVNWAGHIPSGQTSHVILMTTDVFPTACHLADAALPSDRTIDGRNIWQCRG